MYSSGFDLYVSHMYIVQTSYCCDFCTFVQINSIQLTNVDSGGYCTTTVLHPIIIAETVTRGCVSGVYPRWVGAPG